MQRPCCAIPFLLLIDEIHQPLDLQFLLLNLSFEIFLAVVRKDLFFAALVLLAVAACALYFGPFGPSGRPDPTIIQTVPKPDYFFLWLYALLSLLPPSMETPLLLVGPVVVITGLLLLPFLSGEDRAWVLGRTAASVFFTS